MRLVGTLVGGGGDPSKSPLPFEDELSHDGNSPYSDVDGPSQCHREDSADRYPYADAEQGRLIGQECKLGEAQK
ncbi:hypothetical protein EDF46_3455 [Frondihabitans sp. PhB188]|nr:hypothetical protein EDF46_3455 [Frondihabitans sp. PhB188]